MIAIYKYDDCIIGDVEFSFISGYDEILGNCLMVTVIGTATKENTICPGNKDGFIVNVPMPKNILTIGEEGLNKYVESMLLEYRCTDD